MNPSDPRPRMPGSPYLRSFGAAAAVAFLLAVGGFLLLVAFGARKGDLPLVPTAAYSGVVVLVCAATAFLWLQGKPRLLWRGAGLLVAAAVIGAAAWGLVSSEVSEVTVPLRIHETAQRGSDLAMAEPLRPAVEYPDRPSTGAIPEPETSDESAVPRATPNPAADAGADEVPGTGARTVRILNLMEGEKVRASVGVDVCGAWDFPTGPGADGAGATRRVCDSSTRPERCCNRRSDAELCGACTSADEVLEVTDCDLKWRVVCDRCCVRKNPVSHKSCAVNGPESFRLGAAGLLLEPGGGAQLEQSEVEKSARTRGTWRQEGDGIVATFQVDSATADQALIEFGCVEAAANENSCGNRDALSYSRCVGSEIEKCEKAAWAAITRRFGKRSARYEVVVELERGSNGELLSRLRGSDPDPVPGKEHFQALGSSNDFAKTDDCFFVPR